MIEKRLPRVRAVNEYVLNILISQLRGSEHEPYLRLLEIFAYGTYADYQSTCLRSFSGLDIRLQPLYDLVFFRMGFHPSHDSLRLLLGLFLCLSTSHLVSRRHVPLRIRTTRDPPSAHAATASQTPAINFGDAGTET